METMKLTIRETSAFKFAFKKAMYSMHQDWKEKNTNYASDELMQFDMKTWEKILETFGPATEITITGEFKTADGY